MMLRTLALIGLLGVGTASALYTPPAAARAFVAVNIGFGRPPPPRYERVESREGYVWAPGYWRWNRRRYEWVDGYWIRSRPGRIWVGPRWDPDGPHWRLHRGYWVRR